MEIERESRFEPPWALPCRGGFVAWLALRERLLYTLLGSQHLSRDVTNQPAHSRMYAWSSCPNTQAYLLSIVLMRGHLCAGDCNEALGRALTIKLFAINSVSWFILQRKRGEQGVRRGKRKREEERGRGREETLEIDRQQGGTSSKDPEPEPVL